MTKIPFIALVGAVAVAVLYMIYFQIYQVTQEVAGVFIVSALTFGGIYWLLQRRRPTTPETPKPAGKPQKT
jgi:hypothetical protein